MDRKIEKKKWPPKKIAGLALITLFVGAVAYMLIFGDRSSRLNVEKDKITISTVTRGEFQEYIPVYGTVLPIKTIYLSAMEGGRVETRFLESGSRVNKGDEILQLSNTNLLLDIMWRESEVYNAENNLRSTRLMMEQNRLSLRSQMAELEYNLLVQKREFDRAKTLYESELNSKEEFELARDQYTYSLRRFDLTQETMQKDSLFRAIQIEQLESSLLRMKSNLELVKQKQENLTVRAPIDGHLTSLDAELGEMKRAGDPLGQIDVMDAFRVRAGIDEFYLSRVEVGRYGTFEYDDREYGLIVTRVYLEVQDNRFEVDMEFTDEQPEGIRRGMTLHIKLELGDLEEAVLLPRGGFYQKTGGQWVYIVDSSGSYAVKRRIQVGRKNPQVFTVLEGLNPGDRVITSSYDSFGDIDKLILKD
jgi:HlyD family secretion protein